MEISLFIGIKDFLYKKGQHGCKRNCPQQRVSTYIVTA
jgi:hypothetical protein